MSLTRHQGVWLAPILVAFIVLSDAAAETKLTDFNGEWRGDGTDRNSPLEFSQSTNCRTRIRADLHRMTTEMNCAGRDGARKRVDMTIVLDGDRITGTLTETIEAKGAAATVLNGTVSGEKTDDTARIQVSFPGPRPGAAVLLRLLGSSSYSMKVSSLGLMLTDVIFVRGASR